MFLTALALLLAIPGLSSGQYEQVIIDDEGDVSHTTSLDPYGTTVERPNVDIIQVMMTESGGTITVSFRVAGEILDITEDLEFVYNIYLLDENDILYWIQYSGGDSVLAVDGQEYDTETHGIGTDTLSVTFSLDDIGSPNALEIRDAETMKTFDDDEGVTHWFRDTATDDDFQPVNYQMEIVPTIGTAPLEVTIGVSAENTGSTDGEVAITVDNEVIETLEVPAGDDASDTFTYTLNEGGSYTVVFGDEMEYVTVDDVEEDVPDDEVPDDEDDYETGPGDDEDDDSPGFAFLALAVSITLAVLFYKKKQ